MNKPDHITPNKFTKQQLDWLWSRNYLSKNEIRDLIQGWTSIDILIDVEDLEEWEEISKPNSVKFINDD